MRVVDILKAKGDSVIVVKPGDSIAAVARTLSEYRIGAVVVSDDALHVDGILSERDIVAALALHGPATLDMTAAQLMTHAVYTVGLADGLDDMLRLMTERRIRHLPVIEAGALCGVVSIGDVVKRRIEHLEGEAHTLREFITAH
jgi:CBS domain-containing protein